MGICCTINTRGRYLSAKSIAVVNQKGGVGKTTTAVNVAAGLALAGRPTLLIDLDPQGNATTGLGVQKSGMYPTIYHVLLGAESLEKAVRGSELSDLRLVPSDIDLVGAEIELVGLERREHRLAEALQPVLDRSEEHTSELQSRPHLVCRLLLGQTRE